MDRIEQEQREQVDRRRRQERVDDAWEKWAIKTTACPRCGAAVGAACHLMEDDWEYWSDWITHAERYVGIDPSGEPSRSVRNVVSGGAFEMNRRRH